MYTLSTHHHDLLVRLFPGAGCDLDALIEKEKTMINYGRVRSGAHRVLEVPPNGHAAQIIATCCEVPV